MPLHLYFHLPHCRRRCPYCDFFCSIPRAGERSQFIQSLSREVWIARQTYLWCAGPAATVYFGGGTPSLYEPAEIAAILTAVRDGWGIHDLAEITLEANPEGLDAENLAGWRQSGINRISLGVQSFSTRKLKLLYRQHGPEDSQKAVQHARGAGFSNVSLDLIFGLPGENLEEWRADLATALALEPEHLSLYNLEFHEGTMFWKWRQSGRLQPIPEDLEADMYLLAHEVLTDNGYEHYEISNFARPGFRSVHNTAYWEGKPYLGLGPSAHSFDGKTTRFRNVADMSGYHAAVKENRLPLAETQTLGAREQQEEWITLHLRRSEGLLFADACDVLGEQNARALWQRAAALPTSTRVLTEKQFHMTPEGWFREDSVLLWVLAGM